MSNPIIEYYKGVPIRNYNSIVLRLGFVAYKRMIDEVDRTGLSMQKILAYSGKPCEKCVNTHVVAFNKRDEEVKIKRGLLHVPESNGISVIEHHKKKSKA